MGRKPAKAKRTRQLITKQNSKSVATIAQSMSQKAVHFEKKNAIKDMQPARSGTDEYRREQDEYLGLECRKYLCRKQLRLLHNADFLHRSNDANATVKQ